MATFNFNKVNLAAAQIPSAITASQTSITVDASESALFPTVPFFATIMPAGGVPNTLNSEIVQVTAVNTSTGVLTITRAQRSTTAKAQDEGAVIMNGVYIEDLAQAQAVGLAFFSATNVSVSSSYSYWNIDNAMLPTAPTNGMSIRVVFGADTSGPAAQLRLNGGTYHNVYAGVGLTATASNVNTTTPFNPKSGIIYELVYYNNAWYAMNVPANNSITSDNVDWATFPRLVAIGEIKSTAITSGGAFVGLGINSTKTIYDSKYASIASSGEDFTLQPGKYMVIGRIRWLDANDNRNCFFGIRVDQGNTDNIKYGNWGFSNLRLSQETTTVFELSAATNIRTVVFTPVANSVSGGIVWVLRIK